MKPVPRMRPDDFCGSFATDRSSANAQTMSAPSPIATRMLRLPEMSRWAIKRHHLITSSARASSDGGPFEAEVAEREAQTKRDEMLAWCEARQADTVTKSVPVRSLDGLLRRRPRSPSNGCATSGSNSIGAIASLRAPLANRSEKTSSSWNGATPRSLNVWRSSRPSSPSSRAR